MSSTAPVNSDHAELGKFGAQAHAFWDRDGAFRTLHDIDPVRVGYIAAHATLRGARVADIGCGGGLLAESLCRRGAEVTAIDLAPEMITVARVHAAALDLAIDYRLCSLELLAQQQPHSFDIVCCLEMIEHVPDPAALVAGLAQLLRPGGTLFVSTINRTARAFATAIVAAEYLLGLVERGTHEYARLVRPAELAAHARAVGLELVDLTGMSYNPLTRRARLGVAPEVNYLAQLRAPAAS
jgi:2-polyprenyl-6-hydroxyphenyl methylase/3-demethylubiquinone-9 3-methyltransferase